MKTFCRHLSIILPATLIVISALAADDLAPGAIDFGKFDAPKSGGEFVDINLNRTMLSLAASSLPGKNDAELADLLKSIELVRVNVISLDDENRSNVEDRIRSIRAELEAKKWSNIVSVKEKNDDVNISVKSQGGAGIQGVVVTVLSGKKEAVLVNIVGDIKPEKLAALGGKLNLDVLKKIQGLLKKEAPNTESAPAATPEK